MLLSVVMPLYNPDLDRFKDCLKSIKHQTFEEFEFIIIDDSDKPDLNKKILQNYEFKNFLHHVPDSKLGLAKSLNLGINKSSGEYIARCDSDDLYHHERFDMQIKFMKDNPDIDMSGTNCKKIDAAGNEIGFRKYPENDLSIKSRMHIFCPFAHPSIIFRKSFFKKYGLYAEDRDIEDYELWLRSASMGCRFHNIQLNLVQLSVFDINDSSRPRHYYENLKLKIKYFNLNFFFQSLFGIIIFSLASFIPHNVAYKLNKILIPYR